MLKPIQPFDMRDLVDITWQCKPVSGAQVLHFSSVQRPYQDCPIAAAFVEKYLSNAVKLYSDADVLRFASDRVTIDGAYLEMGVCSGKTINFIAALNPHRTIYGFDSFEGLPEDWPRDDITISKGSFALKNNFIPPVLHNVQLYKGLFSEVLPAFKQQILLNKPIGFLHIDCDIYSSTRDVLTILGNNIVPGTIMVFDELYNYPNFGAHEWRALCEFLSASNMKAEFLAFNADNEQVALRVCAD